MTLKQVLFAALLACSPMALAQPLTYGWTDFNGQQQTITFDLPSKRLVEGMLSEKDQVSLAEVQVRAYDTAWMLARASSTSDIIFRVTGSVDQFDIAVSAPAGLLADAEQERGRIRTEVEVSIADPSENGYFIYDAGSAGIRPDYQAIAQDNQDVFNTVARAFLAKFGVNEPLQLINQLLAFLQSIPYDDLLTQPFPMSPPIPMLVEQRGDCEGKQVFLVGVLRELFRDRPIYLINLPDREHIIAGIALDMPMDTTIEHKGRHIVLMDATGPTPYPLGRIPPQFLDLNDRWVWSELHF
ncbi:hypothetical protein DV532_29570 (plasmid) [Pseudomonas sp. Leaf58]|uniref:hypothetical protein n=1 Tax=Pseudomonas sp. Leaf58 TaxID=1736226 RepID=UPI0006FE6A1D|nr:hypothetical protein [Pseudomonas sp. Leaf58]AYG48388.1 hypothetical protein DV532_29570 [Pseudomonas sp. Leaf58]KQN62065.1 hypothetical protein ASF02_07740 [Pseudomonas sp. Leaf58]